MMVLLGRPFCWWNKQRIEGFEDLFILEFQGWGWELLWLLTSIFHFIDTEGRTSRSPPPLSPLGTASCGEGLPRRVFPPNTSNVNPDLQTRPASMVIPGRWKACGPAGHGTWGLVCLANFNGRKVGFLSDLGSCTQIQRALGQSKGMRAQG